MNGRLLLGTTLALLAAGAAAQGYERVERLEGTVVVSGSSATANFVRLWASGFQRHYPKVTVRVSATSSSAAPTAMAANPATIAMMSRPMNDKERSAATARQGRPVTELKVAVDAVGIYVFKDNPVKAISLAQLERVFSATPRGGERAENWGELGAAGAWADQQIIAFGFDRGRGAYEVMRELALAGADFRNDVLQEPVSSSVVQGVAVERGGIGYASVYFRTARTRILPIQTGDGDAVDPTDETIAAGRYPLARYLYLYVEPSAGRKGTPSGEFLRFVLSDEGQGMIKPAGGFRLHAELARAQSTALGN